MAQPKKQTREQKADNARKKILKDSYEAIIQAYRRKKSSLGGLQELVRFCNHNIMNVVSTRAEHNQFHTLKNHILFQIRDIQGINMFEIHEPNVEYFMEKLCG